MSPSLKEVEQAIQKFPAELQQKLLTELPQLLKISNADMSLLKLAERSFDFWDNPEDSVYDNL